MADKMVRVKVIDDRGVMDNGVKHAAGETFEMEESMAEAHVKAKVVEYTKAEKAAK